MSILGTEHPVLAAPMAGGPSTPELVHAAAAAGSLGFVAAGYKTPAAFAGQIAAVRNVRFAVNLFAPNPVPVDAAAYRAYRDELAPEAERFGVELPAEPREDDDEWTAKIDVLLADPVPAVSFTFGLPERSVIAALRRAGTVVIQTVTSPDEAHAAAQAGVDALAVQSWEAGGHWGTLTPAAPPPRIALAELVAAVRAAVELPLLAAGGIASAQDVAAVRAAGAEHVLVGTALLLSDEAATSATHRAALADPAFTDTAQTTAFTGRPARGLRNAFLDAHTGPLGYPALHHLTSPLRKAAAAAGDPSCVHLWAGTGWRAARPAPAAEILNSLAGG